MRSTGDGSNYDLPPSPRTGKGWLVKGVQHVEAKIYSNIVVPMHKDSRADAEKAKIKAGGFRRTDPPHVSPALNLRHFSIAILLFSYLDTYIEISAAVGIENQREHRQSRQQTVAGTCAALIGRAYIHWYLVFVGIHDTFLSATKVSYL
jgi:hypothetical protein